MNQNNLAHLNVGQFLSEYWQKKPLLIRQAIEDFKPELTADELAGLSLEENIRSRLAIQNTIDDQWECRFGPFTESDFENLPETNWTLLVQDVEKHLPEYANLLDYFSFLPRWRIDDLMVSYAVDGGSVGPHTDNYDVFLLQAKGQRHWQIQTDNVTVDDIRVDTDLKILNNFHANNEWTLDPGDILYLPPGVAHHGVAAGECMTFSIGFRAHSDIELLQAFTDRISTINQCTYYADQTTPSIGRRGELDQHSLHQFRHMLEALLGDHQMIEKTLAEYLTEPVDTPALYDIEIDTFESFIDRISTAATLSIHPAVRTLYIGQGDTVNWYIHSTEYRVSHQAADSVKLLIDNYRLEQDQISPLLDNKIVTEALFNLYQDGGLLID
jgi:50S ribosomal protein L16 3-hydroxylase